MRGIDRSQGLINVELDLDRQYSSQVREYEALLENDVMEVENYKVTRIIVRVRGGPCKAERGTKRLNGAFRGLACRAIRAALAAVAPRGP